MDAANDASIADEVEVFETPEPHEEAIQPLANKIATSASRLPPLSEFGTFPPTVQFGKFRDWMKLVHAALGFAPDWDEKTKANWFSIVCGPNIRTIVSSYKLESASADKPFTDLVAKLDEHFSRLTDPTLEYRAMGDCKQESGESANDFFIRLTQLTRYMNVDNDKLRTHFIANIRDERLRFLAIANSWSMQELVAAATRNETWAATEGIGNRDPPQSSIAAVTRYPDRPNQSRPRDSAHRTASGRPHRQYGQPGGSRCPKCGIKQHKGDRCPAFGRSCLKCGQVGHFAIVCKNPSAGTSAPKGGVNQVSTSEDWSDSL